MLLYQSAQVSDSGSGVQITGDVGSGSTASPALQEQGQVYGQAQQQPRQVADLQEDEITYFDPSTIPDSTPIPDTDWVFEVPINVSTLPAEVNKLGVVCEVFSFSHPSGFKSEYGKAKRRLDLTAGSYHDSILIGVDRSVNYLRDRSLEYECYMYLIGPGNRWKAPSSDPNSTPYWRRADPDRLLRWKTDRQTLPE
ncbi:MAG: hypothetical protein L3J57_07900 [Desulfuromusa sp.]|nr:hypothetical protein [Desulfuromusa sp.]